MPKDKPNNINNDCRCIYDSLQELIKAKRRGLIDEIDLDKLLKNHKYGCHRNCQVRKACKEIN